MESQGPWVPKAVAEMRLLARSCTARLGLDPSETSKLQAAVLLRWWQTASCMLQRIALHSSVADR